MHRFVILLILPIALAQIVASPDEVKLQAAIQVYTRIVTEFPEHTRRLGPLSPAETTGRIGWYNGDWQAGLPGRLNYYISGDEYARVYDDFVVPEGGWTIVALFSNNRMDFAGRIQVEHLHVQLAPGRYWVSVSPIGMGMSYLSATRGRNSIGDPAGNNGLAFFSSPLTNLFFIDSEEMGGGGQYGIAKDFSQGVLIAAPTK